MNTHLFPTLQSAFAQSLIKLNGSLDQATDASLKNAGLILESLQKMPLAGFSMDTLSSRILENSDSVRSYASGLFGKGFHHTRNLTSHHYNMALGDADMHNKIVHALRYKDGKLARAIVDAKYRSLDDNSENATLELYGIRGRLERTNLPNELSANEVWDALETLANGSW